jgi:baculoviral IAP repeat-containing protein 5
MDLSAPKEVMIDIHLMFIEENRVNSFKDWVFNDDGCACSPKKMAAAGFYHCATDQEPDAVRCFVCHKELDGWEPADIPLDEHRKHSPNCPYLQHAKNPSGITVEDVLKLQRDRYRLLLDKELNKKIEELREYAMDAAKHIEKLL